MTDQTGHAAQAPSPLDPAGELREVVGDCVHCGFCLPACPTYQLWGEEMDSPRGRIHLIAQLLDGATASPAAALHLDRCLGCMACVPACPSGVRYDRLIEAARAWATEAEAAEPVRPLPPRSARQRALRAAIFATFPYPGRLRALMGPLRAAQLTGADRLLGGRLAERLVPEVVAALRVAPRPPGGFRGVVPPGLHPGGFRGVVPPGLHRGGFRGVVPPGMHRPAARQPRGPMPAFVAARGERRAVVGMLTGCVQQVFFPRVNRATARVLASEGCDVVIPAGQGCCGALSLHDGRRTEASGFARAVIETFERTGVDAIVVNSAGCGSAMKEYADLLGDDPAWAPRAAALSAKVADFSEFLARLGPAATRHPLSLTAAYHDACHLASAQRITAQPRELLTAIPGLTVAELPDAGICCGSAGIYNLVQPGAARQLGARKAASVASTGADLVVSGNPGCALQIAAALGEAGHPKPVAHVAEVLDVSIRALPASSLL